MTPYAQSHATLQGKSYKLKPYSPKNIAAVKEHGAEAEKLLNEGEIDQFEYWDRMLKLVLEEPHEWDITAADFDGREAENAIVGFLPPALQMTVLLAGFQAV